MSDLPDSAAPWQPPGNPPAPSSPDGGPAPFVASVPLGGAGPTPEPQPAPASRRDVVIAALLFVFAVAAGAASLMPWRDYGAVVGPSTTETGWVLPQGGVGRGWVGVVCGVLLAVAGILLVAERERFGRLLAVATGVVLMGFAVLEWGLGSGPVRVGPGLGLWVLFLVGLASVGVVGALGPSRSPATVDPPRAYSSDG